MIGRTTSLAIWVALVFATAAAGEPPTPRPPIGPQEPLTMLPLPGNALSDGSPLSRDSIRIRNVGDQPLFLAYWDGQWRQISIGAGRVSDVACSKCEGTLTVAFHNGKQNETVKVRGGRAYLLGWSAEAGTWVLTPASGQ
jgi:hypothetical protein